jgi:hypothetical protein
MKTKPLSTRRKFFLKAGAAMSAPLAFGTAAALRSTDSDAYALQVRLAALEDERAVRRLSQAYIKHVNARAHDDLAQLFADSSAARSDANLGSLRADLSDEQAAIEIAADRQTATALIPCIVEVATPIDGPGWTLVEMAHRQGDGVIRRAESRILEQTYVRRNDVWKLARSGLKPA